MQWAWHPEIEDARTMRLCCAHREIAHGFLADLFRMGSDATLVNAADAETTRIGSVNQEIRRPWDGLRAVTGQSLRGEQLSSQPTGAEASAGGVVLGALAARRRPGLRLQPIRLPTTASIAIPQSGRGRISRRTFVAFLSRARIALRKDLTQRRRGGQAAKRGRFRLADTGTLTVRGGDAWRSSSRSTAPRACSKIASISVCNRSGSSSAARSSSISKCTLAPREP